MAKSRRPQTLAEQIADLDDPFPRDFEPENEDANSSSSSDDSNARDDGAARDHYHAVEPSTLRTPDDVILGPQYIGAGISRDALHQEGEGDHSLEESEIENGHGSREGVYSSSASDVDGELNGDGAFAGPNKVASARHREDQQTAVADEDTFSGFGSDDEDANSVQTVDSEADESDSMDESHVSRGSSMSSVPGLDEADERDLLRKMMAEEQETAANMTKAVRADIEKGRAIKRQRLAFDSLLNTRIKLQKALVSFNSLSTTTTDETVGQDTAIQAAETAALSLWNNLNSLRCALLSSTNEATIAPSLASQSTPSTKLWSQLQTHESSSLPHRREILTKWSARTAPTTPLKSSKSSQSSQHPLTSVLDQHLSGSQLSHHISRTKVPRSSAPIQASQRLASSDDIYDDADFYALLLRELVEQRSSAHNHSVGSDAARVEMPKKSELRVRKQVDRKASKGRKMRYTVHEKLQNFMAPDDRRTWGERQRAELFASLLGRRPGERYGEVNEDEGEDEDDERMDGEGLRLFG